MSQYSASSSPPVTAAPLMAPITGFVIGGHCSARSSSSVRAWTSPQRSRSAVTAIASISSRARRTRRRVELADAPARRGARRAPRRRRRPPRRSARRSCTIGGRQSPSAPVGQREHVAQLPADLVGAVAVGLVDHEDVADLQDAGLGGLDAVAHARARAARAWCRPARRSRPRSGRPRPSPRGPRRSRRRRAPAAPAASPTASPPRCPRVAIERMKTSRSSAWSCIRTRSPSRAPPENGDDGSTASTPTRCPAARSARDQRVGRGRLADARASR